MYVRMSYIRMYIHMYVHTHMHIYVHMYIHTYIYTHTYVYTYVHMYVHTHINAYTDMYRVRTYTIHIRTQNVPLYTYVADIDMIMWNTYVYTYLRMYICTYIARKFQGRNLLNYTYVRTYIAQVLANTFSRISLMNGHEFMMCFITKATSYSNICRWQMLYIRIIARE